MDRDAGAAIVRRQCERCGYEVVGATGDPPLDECPVCGLSHPFAGEDGRGRTALERGAATAPPEV